MRYAEARDMMKRLETLENNYRLRLSAYSRATQGVIVEAECHEAPEYKAFQEAARELYEHKDKIETALMDLVRAQVRIGQLKDQIRDICTGEYPIAQAARDHGVTIPETAGVH